MIYSDSEGGGKVRFSETSKGFVDVRGKEGGALKKKSLSIFYP